MQVSHTRGWVQTCSLPFNLIEPESMASKGINGKMIDDYWIKKLVPQEGVFHQAYAGAQDEVFGKCDLKVDRAELRYLGKLCNANPLAEFVVYLSVFNVLLRKYFREACPLVACPDIHYGSLTVQDNHLLFFNTRQREGSTLKEYIGSVREELQEVLKHKGFLLGGLIGRDSRLGTTPFYARYGISYGPLHAPSEPFQSIPFRLTVRDDGSEALCLTVYHSSTLIEPFLAEQFLRHFKRLLVSLEEQIVVPANRIQVLDHRETHQLLVDFNDTYRPYPAGKTVVDLFEEQVRLSPEALAVECHREKLTYRELNARANRLAHYLREKGGVRTGDVVAMMLPKSAEAVVTLLAILKAGGAYLPVVPEYPEKRIRYIIADSQVKVLVSESTVPNLPKAAGVAVVELDRIDLAAESSGNPRAAIGPTDLAYVIYTSGSTGWPKGVMVEHGSNVNMSLDQIRIFSVTPRDKVLLFASLSFDASVSEIFMALYCGAALFVPSEEEIKDKAKFVACLEDRRISVVTFPPVYLALLTREEIKSLRCIITAGEAAQKATALACAEFADYFNAYGPTECAVCVSTHKVTPQDQYGSSIPIGKPIANLAVYILDEQQQLAPVGVVGRLFVSGVGVARGYLNKEELTAKRFLPDPFREGGRMYDSGDLARRLPDGNIEFRGRQDDQVKIRGYRVETEEIEQVLMTHPHVKQAVVCCKDHAKNEAYLAAYVVCDRPVAGEELQTHLLQYLPAYMLPAHFVALPAIPLTPNGKVDKKALPEPEINRECLAPRNETEARLVRLWAEILGAGRVGVRDNFFEMGGHSLRVTQLTSRIYKEFGATMPYRDVFSYPTVEAQAAYLLGQQKHAYAPIPAVPPQEYYELSDAQYRLWIVSQNPLDSLSYHITGGLWLEGDLDREALKGAFDALIRRHESLRTVFVALDGTPKQHVLAAGASGFAVEELDFSGAGDGELEAEAEAGRARQQPFDLAAGPLLRVTLIRTGAAKYLLLVNMHHIISDGWSMDVFIGEWIALYTAAKADRSVALPELPVQYKDYTEWQRQQRTRERAEETMQYWRNRLGDEAAPLKLPLDHPRVFPASPEGMLAPFEVEEPVYRALEQLAARHNTTLFTVLFTAFNCLAFHVSGQEDIILGTSAAGREHYDLQRIIGFFVNTLPIRTQVKKDAAFSELLQRVHDNLIDDFAHQEVSFDQLVQKLNRRRDPLVSPLFQARFVFNNFAGIHGMGGETGLRIAAAPFEKVHVKFDLSMIISPGTHSLNGLVEYRKSLFTPETIALLIASFRRLLQDVARNPDERIGTLNTYAPAVEQARSAKRDKLQASFLSKLNDIRKK